MVGEMSGQGNVLAGKCPVGELSIRGNVRRGSVRWGSVSRGSALGEVSVGELSSRGTVRITFSQFSEYLPIQKNASFFTHLCRHCLKEQMHKISEKTTTLAELELLYKV